MAASPNLFLTEKEIQILIWAINSYAFDHLGFDCPWCCASKCKHPDFIKHAEELVSLREKLDLLDEGGEDSPPWPEFKKEP